MTVLNLQSKISDGVINHVTSESEIRNVLSIVRVIVYPIKLYRSISLYSSIILVDFSIGVKMIKIKRLIKTGTEFEKMDAFSDIMFIRESLEMPVSKINGYSHKLAYYPLLDIITKKLNKIYDRLVFLENKYQNIVYPENTEISNPEYLSKLRIDYNKIQHGSIA